MEFARRACGSKKLGVCGAASLLICFERGMCRLYKCGAIVRPGAGAGGVVLLGEWIVVVVVLVLYVDVAPGERAEVEKMDLKERGENGGDCGPVVMEGERAVEAEEVAGVLGWPWERRGRVLVLLAREVRAERNVRAERGGGWPKREEREVWMGVGRGEGMGLFRGFRRLRLRKLRKRLGLAERLESMLVLSEERESTGESGMACVSSS